LTTGREADTGEHSTISAERGVGQRVAAGKILAVTKDRPQRARHRTERRRAADEVLVDAEGFEPRMQPSRPANVAVAVAQKRTVFDRGNVRHARPCKRNPSRDSDAAMLAEFRGRTEPVVRQSFAGTVRR
jgi:hypothetical protein